MSKLVGIYFLVVALFSGIGKSEAGNRYLDLADTMCELGEVVYISCSLDARPTPNDYNGPIASVCAKGNISPDTGYVQYRYGIPGEIVEYVYPLKKIPPEGKFKILPQTRELKSSLRFNDGRYSFAFDAPSGNGFKLIVRDGQKEIINKWCDEPGVNHLVDDACRGIEEAESP